MQTNAILPSAPAQAWGMLTWQALMWPLLTGCKAPLLNIHDMSMPTLLGLSCDSDYVHTP
eukprot:1160588-Pelagomonas_calceolata.AAC.10